MVTKAYLTSVLGFPEPNTISVSTARTTHSIQMSLLTLPPELLLLISEALRDDASISKLARANVYLSCALRKLLATKELLQAHKHPMTYTDRLQVLLQKGANVHARVPPALECAGSTPLHLACLVGNLEAVRILVKAGAKLNVLDDARASSSPLAHAANGNHGAVAGYLLEQGADPNYGQGSRRLIEVPLFFAAKNGLQELVELLLLMKANVNAKSGSEGLTALFSAMTLEISFMLLDAGADVNSTSNWGQTVLHYVEFETVVRRYLPSIKTRPDEIIAALATTIRSRGGVSRAPIT